MDKSGGILWNNLFYRLIIYCSNKWLNFRPIVRQEQVQWDIWPNKQTNKKSVVGKNGGQSHHQEMKAGDELAVLKKMQPRVRV